MFAVTKHYIQLLFHPLSSAPTQHKYNQCSAGDSQRDEGDVAECQRGRRLSEPVLSLHFLSILEYEPQFHINSVLFSCSRGAFVPYALRNETGCTLWFGVVSGTGSNISLPTSWTEVADGSSKSFSCRHSSGKLRHQVCSADVTPYLV